MATAVCIITQSGMKCLASPLKNHFPGKKKCTIAKEDPGRVEKMARIKRSLTNKGLELSKGQQAMIAKVVELLLAANVKRNTAFTIVSAG